MPWTCFGLVFARVHCDLCALLFVSLDPNAVLGVEGSLNGGMPLF